MDNLSSFKGEMEENVMSYLRKHFAFSLLVVWERANNKIIISKVTSVHLGIYFYLFLVKLFGDKVNISSVDSHTMKM